MTPLPGTAWSIRRRLTRGILATVIVTWLGTIVAALWFLDHEMNEGFDNELRLVAETTLMTLESAGGAVVPRVIGVPSGENERVLRIVRRGSDEPAAPWSGVLADGFTDADGWRVLRLTGDRAVIEVAHGHGWRREELAEAASSLLLLLLPMVALLFWGIHSQLGTALAPMVGLARGIGGREPADLSPVPEAGLPQELLPLAHGLNAYLARIDDLRQLERRFVGNAAHELRTPVAAIRARLELSGGAGAAEAVPMLDDLTRRVERLLQLSRSEAGIGLERGPADLVRVVRLVIAEVASLCADPILFDDGDLEQLWVAADPDAIAILIRNLIDNAIEHGTGPVRVGVASDTSSGARLTVTNPAGPVAQFVEEPFGKGPGSRGVGLGLAIVAALVKAMGARIDFQMAGGSARVSVHFPQHRDALA